MGEDFKEFSGTAVKLARNPLGIIALFIVLVYGFASLVTAFSTAFTAEQKTPLIYFLVTFPVLVLGAFLWLVIKHSAVLYGPGDFKNEENYIRMQLSVAASLAAASAANQTSGTPLDIQGVVDLAEQAKPSRVPADERYPHVLWVDDRPENNVYERRAFEAIGIRFTLALSTAEALEDLSRQQYVAIISDMGRREGPREGYVLLDALRRRGDRTPFFIYAGSNAPEHKRETGEHGGDGCTNNAQELFEMVTRSVFGRRSRAAGV